MAEEIQSNQFLIIALNEALIKGVTSNCNDIFLPHTTPFSLFALTSFSTLTPPYLSVPPPQEWWLFAELLTTININVIILCEHSIVLSQASSSSVSQCRLCHLLMSDN